MALKKYFSRLFSSKQEEPAQEQPKKVQETAVVMEEAARPPSVLRAEVPNGHAARKLYERWVRQSGFQPPLSLELEDPGVLKDGWTEKEQERLKSALTRAASVREAASRPVKVKPPKQEGGAPPEKEPAERLPDLDAEPFIFLSADRLAAWLRVLPPVGAGKGLTPEMISGFLKSSGVSYGVKQEMLDRLPEDRARYFRFRLLAVGKPPEDGKDGRIVDFFARVEQFEIKPDEFGNVDYTETSTVQNAEKGDAICQLIPHTEGDPGMTVLGEEIPAKSGKKAVLPKGRNTEASEDGLKLLASQAGRVEFTGRTFQIKSVLELPGNVDYSTGNINFLGDVHVKGDVCAGFSVRAVGSVRVDGVIEGMVEAGGDLMVGKGILAGQESIIRAHRNIFAKYMENSRVHARENLQADCIVGCDVYCDGLVQVLTGRGKIVGGQVSAGKGVNAKIVGSKAEGLTTIVLGGLPCAEYEKGLIELEIEELLDQQGELEKQPDGPYKLSKLPKTRMQVSVARMKLDKMEKDLIALHEALEGTGKARLECEIAYAGTEIIINGKSLRLSNETHKCVARLTDDGEIRVF